MHPARELQHYNSGVVAHRRQFEERPGFMALACGVRLTGLQPMRLLLLLQLQLLLSACSSFSAPSVPGAKQSCIDWYAACRDKAISCGVAPDLAEQVYQQSLPSCGPILWADTGMVYNECIPRELSESCEAAVADSCKAFTHLN